MKEARASSAPISNPVGCAAAVLALWLAGCGESGAPGTAASVGAGGGGGGGGGRAGATEGLAGAGGAASSSSEGAKSDAAPAGASDLSADTPASPMEGADGAGAAASDAALASEAGGAPGAGAPAASPPDAAELHLESAAFIGQGADRLFPKSACHPIDMSPAFTFVGVPAAAKSLALTFVDKRIQAVKWVIWDIPPSRPGLPSNLSKTAHPAELPTSTQRGSLGRTGYSGPGVPDLNLYEFTLYALDVERLPGTDNLSTVQIRGEILPQHTVAKSPVFVARGKTGGEAGGP